MDAQPPGEQTKGPPPIVFDQVVDRAAYVLLRDGFHSPTLIVDGTNKTVIAQLVDLAPTHEKRAAQMFAVGQVAAEKTHAGRMRRAFFISEGWMSRAKDGELPDMPPSEDPERIEVLQITGYELRTSESYMAVLEMIRDDDDMLIELRAKEPEHERTQVRSYLLEAFVDGYTAKENPHGPQARPH